MNCPDCGKQLDNSEARNQLLCRTMDCPVIVVYKDDQYGRHEVMREDTPNHFVRTFEKMTDLNSAKQEGE